MDYQGIKIDHFEHDAFRIKAGGKVIYIDPYNLKENQIEPADYIFITHEHFDHCSENDLKKIISSKTIIIASESCGLEQKFLSKFKVESLIFMGHGEAAEFDDLKVKAVPAYNLNKFRSAGAVYHPQKDGKVGYIIDFKGVKIYHAGDTDNIPEMAELKDIDVAMLPVSGTYVMTWQEAVEAAKAIKPKLAIPMHYGSIVGSEEDAKKFKESAECEVEII
ncbi:MBL fold metallo-hydrolase [Patescibacteria group bacterium]|nr:MBL fold metallo-hydrolase [Patescibacteria group bacterium]